MVYDETNKYGIITIMKCNRCNSSDIIRITAKCSDAFWIEYPNSNIYEGYVPKSTKLGIDIGYSDYVEFAVCLTCKRIQEK